MVCAQTGNARQRVQDFATLCACCIPKGTMPISCLSYLSVMLSVLTRWKFENDHFLPATRAWNFNSNLCILLTTTLCYYSCRLNVCYSFLPKSWPNTNPRTPVSSVYSLRALLMLREKQLKCRIYRSLQPCDHYQFCTSMTPQYILHCLWSGNV